MKKILIVDDCASMCNLVSHFLSVDFDCCSASGAEEALELFGSAPLPDLVLLDLNMPGMGGEALLARMKSDERLKGIKVIILSAENGRSSQRLQGDILCLPQTGWGV